MHFDIMSNSLTPSAKASRRILTILLLATSFLLADEVKLSSGRVLNDEQIAIAQNAGAILVRGTVVQALEKGSLIQLVKIQRKWKETKEVRQIQVPTSRLGTGLYTPTTTVYHSGMAEVRTELGLCYVESLVGMVDEQEWTGMVITPDIYRYKAVDGSLHTVKKFTATR